MPRGLLHRRADQAIEDVAVDDVKIGDAILIRSGEVVPVDGLITSPVAVIDKSALTGEPIPITRNAGGSARSGTLNAGDTFEMMTTATADESTLCRYCPSRHGRSNRQSPFYSRRGSLRIAPIAGDTCRCGVCLGSVG